MSRCEPPQDVYSRLLMRKDPSRGYPLYTPEPDESLPPSYRAQGLGIGDLGVIAEDGGFDFLFNLCLPADHEFNQVHGVPETFKRIDLRVGEGHDHQDVRIISNADRDGQVLSTCSTRQIELAGTAEGQSIAPSAGAGLGLHFSTTAAEGAVLVLPDGTEKRDLKNGHHKLLSEAKKNGRSWYQFVVSNLGRVTSNDSLYLITGYHKTSSWYLASFSQEAGSASLSLTLRAQPFSGADLTASYNWEVSNSVVGRVGPCSGYDKARRNQAVFIRGFKIGIREGLLAALRGEIKVTSEPPTKTNPSRPWNSQPSALAASSKGTLSSRPYRRILSSESVQDRHHDGYAGHTLGDGLTMDVDQEGYSDISLHHIPDSMSKTLQPSDIINKFLLDKFPAADLAITHDSQWIELPIGFEECGDSEYTSKLIECVCERFTPVYDALDGIACLQPKDTQVAVVPASGNTPVGADIGQSSIETLRTLTHDPEIQAERPYALNIPDVVGASPVGLTFHGLKKPMVMGIKAPSMHRGSPPPHDARPCNVIIFGETGVGKSSVINLIAGAKLAKTSPDANSCIFASQAYPVVLQSNRPFWIWDTVGLNEPEISHEDYLRAVEQAYKLIKKLERSGGVHLLVLCMRGRITKSVQQNYKLFAEVFCEKKVPLCVVVTNLENEPDMEGWWTTNEAMFRKYGISADGHACITAIPGVGDVFRSRYEESGERLRKLLLDLDLQLSKDGWKKEARAWLADLLGKLAKMLPLRHRRSGHPTSKELTQRLVKGCGFSRKDAIAIATSIGVIRDQTFDSDGGLE